MGIVDKLKVEAIIICDLVPKGTSFSSAENKRLYVKVEDPEIPQKKKIFLGKSFLRIFEWERICYLYLEKEEEL